MRVFADPSSEGDRRCDRGLHVAPFSDERSGGEGAGIDEPLTTEELASVLTREPFNFTFAQVARLTDYQIIRVLFLPRDKEGRLERPAGGVVSYDVMLRQVWAARGEDVEAKWAEWLTHNPGYFGNGRWHSEGS
jgi:hypothetical protein